MLLDRWLLAALHLLALLMGAVALWSRARALHDLPDGGHEDGVQGWRRAVRAEGVWLLAIALWLGTGMLRAQGTYEKGPAYYAANPYFRAKMLLAVALLCLEVRPLALLGGWCAGARRASLRRVHVARCLARTSGVQAALLVLMILCASAMARGLGMSLAAGD